MTARIYEAIRNGGIAPLIGPAVAPADTEVLQWDAATSRLVWGSGGGGGGGSGDVVGPASSTDNAIVRFDSTTGKLIQNSGTTISDGGTLTAAVATTSNVGAVFQTTDDSTTKKLTEWKDSAGVVVASVSANGTFSAPSSTYTDTERFGNLSSVSGNHAAAFGRNASAGTTATAVGYNAVAGISSVSVGWGATSTTSAVTFGTAANSAANGMALGYVANCGIWGVAIGRAANSNAYNSSISLGSYATTTKQYQCMIGGTQAYTKITELACHTGGGTLAIATETATAMTLTNVGSVTFKASATGSTSINIPHGTAPTSPVDGDMWTTSAGLYVRINGTTVGPLS